VTDYRLTASAIEDIDDLLIYTTENFGVESRQAASRSLSFPSSHASRPFLDWDTAASI
jgi:hypothetical protein